VWNTLSVDVLAPGDPYKITNEYIKRLTTHEVGASGVYTAHTVTESHGTGVTLGAFFPTGHSQLDIGWLFGIIQAPRLTLKAGNDLSSARFNHVSATLNSTFVRFAPQFRVRSDQYGPFQVRFTGAAGISVNRVSIAGSRTDNFSTIDVAGAATYIGIFTEASATVAWTGKRVSLEVGPTVISLPRTRDDTSLPKFEWAPIGVRTTVSF
jgi:hypothetical protein